MPPRISLVPRCRLDPGTREYAEEKVLKLERHSRRLHEVRLTLDGDERRVPAYSAEAVAHLGHSHVTARVEAATQREAVDRVVDKLDLALLRHKERVTEHKGHAHAGSDPADPAPRRVAKESPGG